jgi:MFS family permease
LVGYLTNNLGPRIIMTAGMAGMGFGALAIAFISENTSLPVIELALVVVGIGLGLNTAPVNGVAVAAVPPGRSGTASGVLNTARMVGATMGVTQRNSLAAAAIAKRLRRRAGLLAEEASKM